MMIRRTCFYRAVWILLGCFVCSGISAQKMPNDDVLKKAMQAVQRRASNILADAEHQALPNNITPERVMPQFDSKTAIGIDPAVIAERYKSTGKLMGDNESPELMIFVSLSMPEEALRRIGQQAKKVGAVVVFRGLKYGLRKGAYVDSMNALKPIADTGADVQIHPELFGRYNVTVVPTMVVAALPQSGCQDNACATKSVAVIGDVSVEYALDRLIDRTDAIGKIARDRIRRLRNS
jgi:conjugal transfer pilus assembly protein TrbC